MMLVCVSSLGLLFANIVLSSPFDSFRPEDVIATLPFQHYDLAKGFLRQTYELIDAALE